MRWALILLVVIAAGSAALLVEAALGDSVTIDEFAHLPAGLYYLHTGRFNVYNLSPPLLRLWCALPVWWAGAEADFAAFVTQPNHWLLGYNFMAHNAARYQDLFVLARLPTIGLVVVLIVTLFVAGRRFFGPRAGIAAAALAAFCPNVLAHGHLVTTDLGHALFFLLAVLAHARAVQRRSVGSVVVAGVVLGLAQLTKFTALLLYPTLAIITGIASGRRGIRPRPWAVLASSVALSILILNAGYLGAGSGQALRGYELQAPMLRTLAHSWLGLVPLPLPADFVTGYDQQMVEAQSQYTVFFHGQLSQTGWWYYYVAAFCLKTALPLLLLFGAGAVAWLSHGGLRSAPLLSAVLFLPPLLYTALFSLLTDINLGLRYILPVYPFACLIAASLWATPWARRRTGSIVLTLALLAQVAVALISRPYYLSYFNWLAGGSENGYRWLIDSNLDWGQELLRLRDYMREHGIATVRLAYFGRVAPEVYGIDYEVIPSQLSPPSDLSPAVYAVSASYLMGRPYFVYDHGDVHWAPQGRFARFQHYRPTAVIGHSLFVFDLRRSVTRTE